MGRRVLYGIGTVGYLGGIFLLSSIPGSRLPHGKLWEILTNLSHIPLYAGLTLLVFLASWGGKAKSSRLFLCYSASFLGPATYGIINEWYQSLVPGRSASLTDILLNLSGIVLAIFPLAYFLILREEKKERIKLGHEGKRETYG